MAKIVERATICTQKKNFINRQTGKTIKIAFIWWLKYTLHRHIKPYSPGIFGVKNSCCLCLFALSEREIYFGYFTFYTTIQWRFFWSERQTHTKNAINMPEVTWWFHYKKQKAPRHTHTIATSQKQKKINMLN